MTKRTLEDTVKNDTISSKMTTQRKKRLPCPYTTTYDTPEQLSPFMVYNVEDALKRISNKSEIVLLPLAFEQQSKNDLIDMFKEATVKDAPLMFKWYNDNVKDEFKVPNLAPDTLLRPHLHSKELKPYLAKGRNTHPGKDTKFSVFNLAGGMVNHYNSYLSELLTTNSTVNELFNQLTGTKKWQIHPQRLRLQAFLSLRTTSRLCTGKPREHQPVSFLEFPRKGVSSFGKALQTWTTLTSRPTSIQRETGSS